MTTSKRRSPDELLTELRAAFGHTVRPVLFEVHADGSIHVLVPEGDEEWRTAAFSTKGIEVVIRKAHRNVVEGE